LQNAELFFIMYSVEIHILWRWCRTTSTLSGCHGPKQSTCSGPEPTNLEADGDQWRYALFLHS